MQTCCPNCETLFEVKEDVVRALDARVRCGVCREVFNARDHLQPQAVLGAITPEPSSLPNDEREDTTLPLDSHAAAGVEFAGAEKEPVAADIPFDFFDETKSAGPSRVGWWWLGSLLLLLAIAAQWLYANRAAIVAMPQARPALQQLCELAGCELEPLRDIGQIELLRHSVYSHPNIDKALIISLAMVNNANYSQLFPVLSVRMVDVHGNPVAQRDFEPGQYLDVPSASDLMAPASPVSLTLEIHDPGDDALTFELEFL